MARIRQSAAILLLLILAPFSLAAAPASEDGVLPRIAWDEEQEIVYAAPPLAVLAWMRGQLDDPSGDLEAWRVQYLKQKESPSFSYAMIEIQDLVRGQLDRGEMSGFHVNEIVIPQILRDRADLRAALRGEAARLPVNHEKCYKELPGKETCEHWIGFFCDRRGCHQSDVNQCTITIEIPCFDHGTVLVPKERTNLGFEQ